MHSKVTESIYYIGADDKTLDLFESQYPIPNGVSYNSYLIVDEKIAIMDSVDLRATETWFANLEEALNGREPDYLIISHLESDHSGNIQKAAERYPQMKLVSNLKVFAFLPQFFDLDLTDRFVAVQEGDTLNLGSHTLSFIMAPMVHWPEVMVTYESSEKILFTADGFGKFGALDINEEWASEARRYFINIVGKYGIQVQNLLKKVANLDIEMICPLHGPVLKGNLGYYIGLYDTWSSYRPEEPGIVIASASIHGNTMKAAQEMARILRGKTKVPVKVYDLARDDMSLVIAEAYRYDRMVLAAASYDGGVFLCMEDFLTHLKYKVFQNRKVGLIENGTWSPSAGRVMKAHLEEMKNIQICDTMVTIRSAMTPENRTDLERLADELLA